MIRKAHPHDLDRLDALSALTVSDMLKRGIHQWTTEYPRKPHFQRDMEHDALYVFERDGIVEGAMALYEENDPPYRTIEWMRDSSMVIHRILVSPEQQHRGIATALVEYALDFCRHKNVHSLKIDTHPANNTMRRFLKKNGFHEMDYIASMHRIGYERLIALKRPQRIMILGSAGTGKTTLAKMISAKLAMPYLHLDSVYWVKDWQRIDPNAFVAQIRAFMNKHEQFVIDGNYANHIFAERVHLADTIIILEYDLQMSLKGIIAREHAYKHRFRSDMAEGCIEQIDQEFLKYVYNFENKLHKMVAFVQSFAGRKKIYRFKDRRTMLRWFAQL